MPLKTEDRKARYNFRMIGKRIMQTVQLSHASAETPPTPVDNTPVFPKTGLERTKEIRKLVQCQTTHEVNSGQNPDISCSPFIKETDNQLIKLFGRCFRPELDILSEASPTAESNSGVTIGGYGKDEQQSPSQMIFGDDKNFNEVNRTIVGALALKWLVADDYETFTCSQQPVFIKLSQQSFQEIRRQVLDNIKTPEELYCLLVSMIINDLGKKDPPAEGDEAKQKVNHDEIILQDARKGKIELLNEFKGHELQRLLLLGLEVGAKLNVPQFAQAENAPGSLSAVKVMSGHDKAFELKLLEIILDVAGAQGHANSQGAKAMLEPTWNSFSTSRELLFQICSGQVTERQAYDLMLEKRAGLLASTGFEKLNVHVPKDRALLRLVTMARALEKNGSATIVRRAFDDMLSAEDRGCLIDGLNVDGITDGTAIIPYYAPSLFANVFKKTKDSSDDMKITALAALLRVLVKVFAGTKPHPNLGKGMVVECQIRFLQDIIEKDENFIRNPNILEEVSIETSMYSVHPNEWLR